MVQAMKAKEELLKRQQEVRVRMSKPRRPSSSRPRPGGVTLKLLIDEGLLQPGPAVLSLEYRGLQETGDLLVDGRIQWKGGAVINCGALGFGQGLSVVALPL